VTRPARAGTAAGIESSGATRVGLAIAGWCANQLPAAGFIALQVVATSPRVSALQVTPPCATAHSYVASAHAALAAGDSATALERLNRAIAVASKCPDAYLLLGLTEFQRGETAKSILHYKEALKLEPRSYSGHYDLALAYLKENKVRDARGELERAVALDPKQANAAYDLGIVLLNMGQPAAALPHLRHAHAMTPNRPDVSFNIVRAELEAGQLEQARQAAREEKSQLSSDFQWNVAIGQLFLKHVQPGDAALYFRAANLIRPGDEDVRYELATAYLASRQPENVLDLIKEPKTAEEHYLRGSAFYQAHRFTDADEESEAALTLAPENPRVLVLRVRLLQRAGQQNAAVELAQKATVLAPDWDEPFYLAGISYYFIRHYTQARQNLARAFELNPNSATSVFMEALAWANEGKPQESERNLRRAIALQPDNARFHCHMGILLMRENHNAEAEESFKKAVQLKPGYALPHYELGKLWVYAQRWKEAKDELERAISADPGLTSAYYQLSRVYDRLGEREKAERMLTEFKRLHQQEMDDSKDADEDARKESDSR
jgi:tetratricopeptide (TPR) repeat protein